MTVWFKKKKNEQVCVWKCCKPLLSKKNMVALFMLAKLNLKKPQDIWINVLWTDETKTKMFGKKQTNRIGTNTSVKHNTLVMMIWWLVVGGFAATGPLHQTILEPNARQSDELLKLHFGHATGQWSQYNEA